EQLLAYVFYLWLFSLVVFIGCKDYQPCLLSNCPTSSHLISSLWWQRNGLKARGCSRRAIACPTVVRCFPRVSPRERAQPRCFSSTSLSTAILHKVTAPMLYG